MVRGSEDGWEAHEWCKENGGGKMCPPVNSGTLNVLRGICTYNREKRFVTLLIKTKTT